MNKFAYTNHMLSQAIQSQITQAVSLLKKEEVVGFPTETVYGLGAIISSEVAIKKIFSTKERPFFDPLIVHVSSIEQAQTCTTDWNEMAEALANAFWPGPLTLVLPKSSLISDLITSGLPSVGIRFPAHLVAQEIIKQVGVPVAAPSANKFGRTSPTKSQHVREEFGDSIFVVDSDPSEIGIESTVLLVKKAEHSKFELSILRKGIILKSDIDKKISDSSLDKQKLNYLWIDTVDKKESPGHMKHHYMPSVPLVICKDQNMKLSALTSLLNEKLSELPDQIEGVKIIKPIKQISKIEFLKLSNDPAQAAREVYSQLRSASLRKPDVLCFIQLSHHTGEMWESIFDRLYKAASLIVD